MGQKIHALVVCVIKRMLELKASLKSLAKPPELVNAKKIMENRMMYGMKETGKSLTVRPNLV